MAFWKSEGKGEFFDLEIPRHRGSYDCNSQGMFSFFSDLGSPTCESTNELTTLLTNMESRILYKTSID